MVASAFAESNAAQLWGPVRDEVYLQETGRNVASAEPLNAVAVFKGKAFTSSDRGLYEPNGDNPEPVSPMRETINRLVATSGGLWTITGHRLWRYQSGAWEKISGDPVADVTEHLGEIIVAGGKPTRCMVQLRLWRADRGRMRGRTGGQPPARMAARS